MGIEVGGAAENLGRNLILLDGSAGMIQDVLGEIAEQLAQLLGAVQGVTIYELIDLPEILLSLDQSGLPQQRFNRSVTTHATRCNTGLYAK